MGDGTRVKFWHDVWCGDYPLKEAFPEFYCINRSMEASLGCTILINWELESLALFMDLIYSTSVQGDDCDKSVGSQLRVEVLRFMDIHSSFPSNVMLAYELWTMPFSLFGI